MIVLLLLLATARAVTIDSPAKWNIVDGVIPKVLDAEKGCHSGLRISETKPLASIPISCANIRYSVYDSSVATMGYDDVTIDRSYTERNVVSKDGVCKMQMSSMDSTTAADVYTKGQDMKFFSRYGYCDGTYTGTKHFAETTFESDRSCQEGGTSGYPFSIHTGEECALYAGKNVTNVIGDRTSPYGCWSDGTFNEFNREEDLHGYLNSEVNAAKTIRKQALLYKLGNLTEKLNTYSFDATPATFVPETITTLSTTIDCWGTSSIVYQCRLGQVRAFLMNMVEYINSAWAKFKYIRDLKATAAQVETRFKDMKEDMIVYNELVEKLKLYDHTVEEIVTIAFDNVQAIFNNIATSVESLGFNTEVEGLGRLFANSVYDKYEHAFYSAYSHRCTYSHNHRLYTTVIGCTDVSLSCYPANKDGVSCYNDGNHYAFIGLNVQAPCANCAIKSTINFGFPESSDDSTDQSALVKLGLKTKFAVNSDTTSFKYLGIRDPLLSEKKYLGYGHYEDVYDGIHHVPDFYSIYLELKDIVDGQDTTWKAIDDNNDYTISYEVPDETLSEVDRENRAEARELSLSNIRARETAIARKVLRGNTNDLDINPLYESLVKLNHKCENCLCYAMPYDMNNDKPYDIRADCKEQCVGHDGFLLQWDTNQPRVVSQRDRHRSSCVCAGDGEPVSELDCVLSNREWIYNRHVDQYELNAKDPTVKTGVQTKDVYLHCPGPMCSNGPTEGCWDDTICNVGEFCTEVSGTVSAVFKTVTDNQLKFLDNTTKIVHPQRLTSTTFLFRDHITKSQLFILAGGQYTRYTHYIVGITTDLYGNQLEVKAYEREGTYTNDPMTKAYWDSLQTSWGARSTADVSVQFGRVVSEEGGWCDSGWFNNGCQEGCKPGFLEEDCSCGDSACKAGQYCTKDGVCKDVVKKEKKFLQIRYNSLG